MKRIIGLMSLCLLGCATATARPSAETKWSLQEHEQFHVHCIKTTIQNTQSLYVASKVCLAISDTISKKLTHDQFVTKLNEQDPEVGSIIQQVIQSEIAKLPKVEEKKGGAI